MWRDIKKHHVGREREWKKVVVYTKRKCHRKLCVRLFVCLFVHLFTLHQRESESERVCACVWTIEFGTEKGSVKNNQKHRTKSALQHREKSLKLIFHHRDHSHTHAHSIPRTPSNNMENIDICVCRKIFRSIKITYNIDSFNWKKNTSHKVRTLYWIYAYALILHAVD